MNWTAKMAMVAGALACFAFAVLWKGLPDYEALKVGFAARPGTEALMYAMDSGRLSEVADLRLVEMPGVSTLMRALENEVVDGAVLSLDEVLQVQDGGHAVRIALVLEESAGADVVLGGRTDMKLTDLKGARVGVPVRSAQHYLLYLALKSVGMSLADVIIVPLNQTEAREALNRGEIDAMVVSEPFAYDGPSSRLFDSSGLEHPITRVLAVREGAWVRKKDAIQMLAAACYDVQEDLRSGKDAVVASLSKRTGLGAAALRESLGRSLFPGRRDNAEWLNSGRLNELILATQTELIRAGVLKDDSAPLPRLDIATGKESRR